MPNFLEVCGLFYLLSGTTMAVAAAVEHTRNWYVQMLRRHEYHQLAHAQYHRVSAYGW